MKKIALLKSVEHFCCVVRIDTNPQAPLHKKNLVNLSIFSYLPNHNGNLSLLTVKDDNHVPNTQRKRSLQLAFPEKDSYR